jgi:hypothetical protein
MLILSVGMVRSGSGWRFNFIHDLVVASGGNDTRVLRRKYFLQYFITEDNCIINTLKAKRLLPVIAPSILGNDYVISTHAKPQPFALALIRRGAIRPIYGYRDPRASIISLLEYSQRAYERYSAKDFLNLRSIEDAIDYMNFYLQIWDSWVACEDALHVRYEDMLSNYDAEVTRLLSFLGIVVRNPAIDEVIKRYQPGNVPAGRRGMHYEKGEAERFRQVFSPEQLDMVNQAFEPFLEKMGYSL